MGTSVLINGNWYQSPPRMLATSASCRVSEKKRPSLWNPRVDRRFWGAWRERRAGCTDDAAPQTLRIKPPPPLHRL
jgi:hypothetical protein